MWSHRLGTSLSQCMAPTPQTSILEDPERSLPDKSNSRHPKTHLPGCAFRNCVLATDFFQSHRAIHEQQVIQK